MGRKPGSPNKPKAENTENTENNNSEFTPKNEETVVQQPTANTAANTSDKPLDELPSDLLSNTIPNIDDPLEEGTVKKDYSTIGNESQPKTDGAAKPDAAKTTTTSNVNEKGEFVPGSGTTVAPQQPLGEGEQRAQAEQAVDVLFDGYEMAHMLGRRVLKYDDAVINSMHIKGEIDLNESLNLGGKEVTLKDIFNTHNVSIDTYISLDAKFKEKFKPALIRIFIKKGWFLSDELFVIIGFGKDVLEKASVGIALVAGMNTLINEVKEMKAIKLEELKKAKDADEDYLEYLKNKNKSKTTDTADKENNTNWSETVPFEEIKT